MCLQREYRGSVRFGSIDQRNWSINELLGTHGSKREDTLSSLEYRFSGKQFGKNTANRPNVDGRTLNVKHVSALIIFAPIYIHLSLQKQTCITRNNNSHSWRNST